MMCGCGCRFVISFIGSIEFMNLVFGYIMVIFVAHLTSAYKWYDELSSSHSQGAQQ